jgi:flagellar basal-body rod modification protein FlgD
MAVDAIGIVPSATPTVTANTSISQQDFLQILLTQLQFQDPLKPVDNEQFIAQLAQFTALEINRQQSQSVDNLLAVSASNQAIGLIGKSVQISSTTGSNGTAAGTVTAVQFVNGSAQLTVTTSSNEVITAVPLSDVTLIH